MTKSEYLEVKLKRDQLTSRILDFEGGFSEFQEENLFYYWNKWTAIRPSDQEELRKKWDQYYIDCHDSPYGVAMRTCSVLSKAGKTEELLRTIADLKATNTPFVKKPSSVDPEELELRMQPYFTAKNRLARFGELVEQYAPLYESKKNLQVDSF